MFKQFTLRKTRDMCTADANFTEADGGNFELLL